MISAITGSLSRVEENRIHVQVGAMLYELLVPAVDVPELQGCLGTELTFHTILYLEGDPNRGNLEPRLIGFLRPEDRQFFDLFTTVKGIGPKTALRALSVSTGEIARAIEDKDNRFLFGLDGIGKRTAELIIAELGGKTVKFATGYGEKPAGTPYQTGRPGFEEDAIAGLMALGERRADAERLLDRAKSSNAALKTTDALLREMLRLRTSG